jgi:hypothetical protein
MAKKPTVPSGVAQMSEEEFAEMASKQTPSIRGPKVDLNTVVQRLRSNNVEKVINIVIKRNGELINISLIPKLWKGNGLLGCHLTPR